MTWYTDILTAKLSHKAKIHWKKREKKYILSTLYSLIVFWQLVRPPVVWAPLPLSRNWITPSGSGEGGRGCGSEEWEEGEERPEERSLSVRSETGDGAWAGNQTPGGLSSLSLSSHPTPTVSVTNKIQWFFRNKYERNGIKVIVSVGLMFVDFKVRARLAVNKVKPLPGDGLVWY